MSEQFSILIDSRSRFETGQPGGVWLPMPATAEQLHEAMKSVGITADNPQDFFINGFANTEQCPFDVPLSVIQSGSMDELNYLGKLLEMQRDEDKEKFAAAVTLGEYAGNLKDLINIAQNLDCYWIYPTVQSEKDYGYYLIDELDELELPEAAKKYFMYEEYGRDAVRNDRGKFTEQGYIYNNKNTFSEWYNGLETDIPGEYRIMSYPQPERPDPEKADMDATITAQAAALAEPRPVIAIIPTSDNPTEKLKEITDRLEQGITDIFDSQRYTDYLRVMSKFHNYSFNNTLLIAMQAPDATHVMGFNAWKDPEIGRNVKAGEKGIRIIAPSPYKVKREVEKIDPDTKKPVVDKDGKPVTEEQEITIPKYKVVCVYDVAQTEGKELPSLSVNELVGDVEQYKDFFAALERTSPFAVGFEALGDSVKGRCFYEERRIAINEGMSELQNIKTAIHEIAHATLHDTDPDAPDRPDRRTREVQAESVAYAVCQHYGLDTSDYSFGYIAGWSSGREHEELKNSLETIRSTAAKLIDTIDRHFAEIQKAQDKTQEQTAEQEPPVFDKLTPEKQAELSDNVKAMLQTLIDADMQAHGEVTDGTFEAIRTQGYFYHDGELTKAAPAAEPTVTVVWSESGKVQDGQIMSLSEADKLFASLDAERHAEHGGSYYDKTAFRIDYVMNGKADSYGGRQDFGDGDGGLIAHIEKYHTYYADNPDWDNYLLRNEGKEALDADKAHREMLLHEFVPYLKLHTNLSEMEQAAQAAMLRGEELTQTEAAYYTALQQYVSDCRGALNQGSYELPPVPQLADFDAELEAYKQQVREEIAQEAASAGMTVEEYAANGYEPYAAAPEPTEPEEAEPSQEATPEKEATEQKDAATTETAVKYYPINETAARRAKEMNSFSDYKPGSATAEYRHYVDKAAEVAAQQKKRVDPSFHEKIDSLLDTYARKLADNMNKGFAIESRVPSILIAGGSNFPVRKKEKQNAARDRNMEEWREIEGLLDKIRSTGMGGISADDPQAVQKLESKLAKLEQAQETMKAVNAYYRKHKTLDGCPHLSPERIENLKADMSNGWRVEDKPYPTWTLSNNNAEIRRIKDRIASLTRRKEIGYVGWEFEGGKVEANTQDNRLQIFFDEKPAPEVRDELKGNGFKWSPKAEAWQRQLNDNAIYAADRIKSIQPLTGERPTEVQKRARQQAAAPEQTAEPQEVPAQAKAAEPEYIYMVHANPRSESMKDRYLLQAYVPQEDGRAKIGDVLFIGTPDKCRELMQQLNAGELTQGEVKELFAQQQAQEQAQAQEETKAAPEQTAPEKDTFSIYQLKRGDETRDLRFEPYDRLTATGHTVDPANYDLIYTADLTPDMTLGSIWETFNIDHPKDFKGYSLSVSDVVVLHQNGQDTAHYVDSIGYQQVPEFLQPQQEKVLTPDELTTGEKITTPRGSFHVTAMTREQMEAAGYGFHHQSEDGKHLIMGNGTRAFAVAAEPQQRENPLKHVEDTIEQNDNKFDGLINNTPQTPTVDALEQKAKSGEPISLTDLADAIKADKQRGKSKEEKPSIRAQLKADKERAATKKAAAKSKNHDLEV